MMDPQSIDNYRVRWRPTRNQGWRAGNRPVSRTRYQGYRFRPWQQNYRYRPNFPQHQGNYQAHHYRWRPLAPLQPGYRWNTSGMPAYQAGNYPSVQGYPVFTPRFGERGMMPTALFQREGYAAYPPGQWNKSKPATRVYRSSDITIPNHYVFRPLSPNRQVHKRVRFVDNIQRGLTNRSHAGHNNMADRYRFRPVQMARQTHPAQSDRIASLRYGAWRSTATDRSRMNGRQTFNPFFAATPVDSYRARQGYRFRQQPRFPAARFLYPSHAEYGPAMASYRPVHNGLPAFPYRVDPYYPGRRMQPENHAQKAGYSNSYDGQPDSVGSWYKSGNSSEWPMVSQSRQTEYPLMEYDRASF